MTDAENDRQKSERPKQKNSENISLNDIDDIIAFILKDTAYQMINDQTINSDIRLLFNNDEKLS